MGLRRSDSKGMELARDLAWEALAAREVRELALRCGGHPLPDGHGIRLRYLAWDVTVDLDEQSLSATAVDLTLMETVLILRYLVLCDGTPPSGKWMSFRELPGGRSYFGPFQGRTAQPLAERFGCDREAFERASRALDGDRLAFGDSAFLFRLLPNLWMAVVLNMADEEFPAEVTMLFDSAVAQCFTTEDCVAAAQVLSHRLLCEAG